jgi:hypothetical protein
MTCGRPREHACFYFWQPGKTVFGEGTQEALVEEADRHDLSIEFHMASSRPQQRMKMGWALPGESVTALGFRTRDRVCILPRRGTTDCGTSKGVNT